MTNDFEVAVVGAGPAGLSAALMLGRCRRKVVVFDDGNPRNAVSRAAHGYLTRDGIAPEALRRIALEEVERYGVVVRRAHVEDVTGRDGAFALRTEAGETVTASKLLLATGLVDRLPPIEGISEYYGRSAFHCPYCDAWEFRDRPLCAYGGGRAAAELALSLRDWSSRVVLLLDGARPPSPGRAGELACAGVRVCRPRVAALGGEGGMLAEVRLADGTAEPCQALFFHLGSEQRSDLPARLGVARTRKGTVHTGRFEETNVPGVWVAGDASQDVQWIVIAAAEGARAAFAIHRALRGRAW